VLIQHNQVGTMMRRRGGLGSPSYDLAKQLVGLLEENDYPSAVAILSGLSAVELQTVATKAIALGADPSAVRGLIATLGQNEIIEVTGSAPLIRAIGQPLPLWLKILLGAGVVFAAAWAYKKWRK